MSMTPEDVETAIELARTEPTLSAACKTLRDLMRGGWGLMDCHHALARFYAEYPLPPARG